MKSQPFGWCSHARLASSRDKSRLKTLSKWPWQVQQLRQSKLVLRCFQGNLRHSNFIKNKPFTSGLNHQTYPASAWPHCGIDQDDPQPCCEHKYQTDCQRKTNCTNDSIQFYIILSQGACCLPVLACWRSCPASRCPKRLTGYTVGEFPCTPEPSCNLFHTAQRGT